MLVNCKCTTLVWEADGGRSCVFSAGEEVIWALCTCRLILCEPKTALKNQVNKYNKERKLK